MTAALARIARRSHGRGVLTIVGLSVLALGVLASAHASASSGGNAIGGPGGAQVTGDESPRISIGDASVLEGDSGTTAMVFTVTRSGDHGTSSVHYETQGVTATSGVDFTPASGQLSFPTGVTTRTITVPVIGDLLDEGDEVLVVNLSNPNGGHIIDGQGVGTII